MLKIGEHAVSGLFVGDTKIKKVYLGNEVVFEKKGGSRLPDGYKEVKYIELGNSNTYFDTYIKIDATTEIEFDFQILSGSWPTNASNLGAATKLLHASSAASGTQFIVVPKSTGIFAFWGVSSSWTSAAGTSVFSGKSYEILNFKASNIAKTILVNGYSETFSGGNPTYNLSIGSTTNNSLKGLRIYGFKVYQNSALVMDLVPCIRPNGVVCLYNLISNKEVLGYKGTTNGAAASVLAGPDV